MKLRVVAALTVLAAFLFADLLCVTPQLHAKIHGPSVNHECAVTLIASGKYELGTAPAVVPVAQPFVEFSPLLTQNAVIVPALFLSAAIFEHAPPAIS